MGEDKNEVRIWKEKQRYTGDGEKMGKKRKRIKHKHTAKKYEANRKENCKERKWVRIKDERNREKKKDE